MYKNESSELTTKIIDSVQTDWYTNFIGNCIK